MGMDDQDIRRLLSTALGSEPPNRFEAAGVVARGRRARIRRRFAASAGAAVAVAALTLPLAAAQRPADTRSAAPAPSSVEPTPFPTGTAPPPPASGSSSPAPPPSPDPTGPVVLTAGCATADPGAANPDEHGLPANQPRLMDVHARLEPEAKRRFRKVYAGMRLASPRDRVEVFRKPSPAFDRWVLREFADECVEVRDAAYSAVEISSRADQVMADRAYWAGRNIEIVSVSYDYTGRTLPVAVLGDVARARAEFPERYGAGVPVEVSEAVGRPRPLVGTAPAASVPGDVTR